MKKCSLFVMGLMVCMFGATPLLAGDYLPLELGNWWNYLNENGDFENKVVDDLETILERETAVILYTESPDNQGLKNFWSSGDQGEVYLHGFSRGFGMVYDPPVKFFDPNVAVGESWTEVFDLYDYVSGDFIVSTSLTFVIYETGIYEVGAGSFPAIGVGYLEDPALRTALKDFDLKGEIRTDGLRGAESWFSEGVGEIISAFPDYTFELDSYFGGTVPTTTDSFDGIKALFR